MLCVLLYLPVEALLFIVIKRHSSDSLFTMRLKEALSKGELELIALIEEQRNQLKNKKSDTRLTNLIQMIRRKNTPKFASKLQEEKHNDSLEIAKDPNQTVRQMVRPALQDTFELSDKSYGQNSSILPQIGG